MSSIDFKIAGKHALQENLVMINLSYLTSDQARYLIKMFDSPEAYAENFSALKAITRGLYKVIESNKPSSGDQLLRMFKTVNDLQGTLMLDDMQEHERIISRSGLMPDPWGGFNVPQGVDIDKDFYARKGGDNA